MNIFKNNLNTSLFERAEKRIISLFKNRIPERKKELTKVASILFILSLVSSTLVIGSFLHSFIDSRIQSLLCMLFGMISFGTIIGLTFILRDICKICFYGKKLISSDDDAYHYLSTDYNFNTNLNVLNDNEIHELFSSPLHPIQLKYLQNKIIYGAKITIEHLQNINDLVLKENQEKTRNSLNTQIENEKIELDKFFSLYDINIKHNQNYQTLSDNIMKSNELYQEHQSHEKEINLTSRL